MRLQTVLCLWLLIVMGCGPVDQGSDLELETSEEQINEETHPPPPEPGQDRYSDDQAEKLRKSFMEYNLNPAQQEALLEKYQHVDPKKMIPESLLKKTLLFYETNLQRISNQKFVTIIDYSKRSSLRRMFLIEMSTGLVTAFHVAHGRGSDPDNDGYATKFLNTKNSNASSLGYYLTAETYYGRNGRSLRIDGLSDTNSNARRRDVVIHGSKYVKNFNSKPGRSFGCPALAMSLKDKFIDKIKSGSLIYAGLSTKP